MASFNQGINPTKDAILCDFENGIYRKSLYLPDDTVMSVYDLQVRNGTQSKQEYASIWTVTNDVTIEADFNNIVVFDQFYNGDPIEGLEFVPGGDNNHYINTLDEPMTLVMAASIELAIDNSDTDDLGSKIEINARTNSNKFDGDFSSKDFTIARDLQLFVQEKNGGIAPGQRLMFFNLNAVFTLKPGKWFKFYMDNFMDCTIESGTTYMRLYRLT